MEILNEPQETACLPKLQQQLARYKKNMENGAISSSGEALNETENRLFDALKQKYKEQISKETVCSATEAETLFEAAIAPYGKRMFIDFYVLLYSLKPIMVNGLPYTYFCMNAVICVISYVWTGNFIVTLFTAPSIHILQLIYYRYNKERLYNAALEKAMQKGITIEEPARVPLTKQQLAFMAKHAK